MIVPLLLALSAASAKPAATPVAVAEPPVELSDIDQAIRVGRLEQAQIMIGRAMAGDQKGAHIDLILADLAFAQAKYDEALVRYKALLAVAPDDAMLLERAGISALKAGQADAAIDFLNRATKSPGASWRAWNARGVAADFQRDWTTADAAYAKAASLVPGEAEVVNNRGWSLILRGDWSKAVGFFEQAAISDPKSQRIANNLELARAALATDLPRRRAGEEDQDWAARLNDAGVAARLLGDKARAVAAFSQALEARGSWYERAANNLKAANSQ
jgi:Flp pilus assembly protein TadD